jgi:hypothetical protein
MDSNELSDSGLELILKEAREETYASWNLERGMQFLNTGMDPMIILGRRMAS